MYSLLIGIPVVSVASLAGAFLYQRFKRSAPDVPSACHVAAAFALVYGCVTLVAGVAHSLAVASMARRLNEYGSLQVLWFTTGALLVYTGAMNAVMSGGIKAGRASAIGLAAAASLLFVVHLLFVDPLPGSGTTIGSMLTGMTLYLLSLIAAGIAVFRSRRLYAEKAGAT